MFGIVITLVAPGASAAPVSSTEVPALSSLILSGEPSKPVIGKSAAIVGVAKPTSSCCIVVEVFVMMKVTGPAGA